MHRGYIKLWRRIEDSEVFSLGLEYIGLFSYLLIKANHKPGWFLGQQIGVGEFACSIGNLAKKLKVSRSKLIRMLKRLESAQAVTHRANNRFTIITICNYKNYQGDQRGKRTEPRTTTQTSIEHQADSDRTQSKKAKKEKKQQQRVSEAQWQRIIAVYPHMGKLAREDIGMLSDLALCHLVGVADRNGVHNPVALVLKMIRDNDEPDPKVLQTIEAILDPMPERHCGKPVKEAYAPGSGVTVFTCTVCGKQRRKI